MKTKIAVVCIVLLALVAALAIAVLRSPSLRPRTWAVGEAQWKSREPIVVTTRAEQFGVQKGDVFPYLVEVGYNTDAVAEIDKTDLDKGVNLAPFEVRGIKESELNLEPRLRVYRREYQLQLIKGKVDQTYEFPAIVLRYRPKDSDGLLNVAATPQPIFVSSRFPANIDDLDLELKPVAPTIVDLRQESAPWILWGLGGLFAVLAVANLVWRVVPRWKRAQQATGAARERSLLEQAYRSLRSNVAASADPQCVLHQMDHIVRLLLASKDGLNWLEEPNLADVPSGIGEPAASLLEKCQKAYQPVAVGQKEVEEAVGQLEILLRYYCGEREVEAWRS